MDQEPDVIRQQIDETRSALATKVETLEEKVRATVEGAKETVAEVTEAVQGTIENVKESVQDTVASVKKTFDLRCQTERHPWTMMAGSLVTGFLVGNLIEGRRQPSRRFQDNAANLDPWRTEQRAVAADVAPRAPAPARPGLTDKLKEQFGDELEMVKGMAVAALMGLARDMAKQYLPQLGTQIDRMMNNATRKFGAEPVRESMLDGPGSQFRG